MSPSASRTSSRNSDNPERKDTLNTGTEQSANETASSKPDTLPHQNDPNNLKHEEIPTSISSETMEESSNWKNSDSTTSGSIKKPDEEEAPSPIHIQDGTSSSNPVGPLTSSPKRNDRGQSLHVQTNSITPPPPPQKDGPYLDPTPRTPAAPRSPSDNAEKGLPGVPQDDQLSGKQPTENETKKSEESQIEIQSIMDQFSDETRSLRQDQIMSPRLELADQFQGHFPPRKSSLEPVNSGDGVADSQTHQWKSRPDSVLSVKSHQSMSPPAVPPKSPPRSSSKTFDDDKREASASATGAFLPEPEPDQPFDFHRFLEQLRHRTADPVAKFLRSFLTEFGKRQWMVHEQVKIISDFLAFITNKMAQCDVWRDVSDVEFDNAKEGMEKLVMNRLYSQTFSPAIPPPPPIPSRSRSRSRRKEADRAHGPGRRGQHQEDVERDEILAQKIRIYSWVREDHLDIPQVGSNGRRFLSLAQQELLKIKGYRAPRDKVICILNCCKVIFGLLRNAKKGDTSADSFIPLLIYVVLRANPEHLVSNVQYILRFRNQEKLGGEAGYYLSSLSGAIQFVETLDRTSLTVSDEDFEKNVEAAVSAIAERNSESEAPQSLLSEKTSTAQKEATQDSLDADQNLKSKDPSYSSGAEDNAPVAGLLRTIQKPLTTIGRIFSDDTDYQRDRSPFNSQQQSSSGTEGTAYQTARRSAENRRPPIEGQRGPENIIPQSASRFDAQEAAARQASAEAAEANRIQRAEHDDVVETLSGMFPNLDKDLIDDVVRMKEGRVGLAVDACLALSAE